MRSSSSSLPDVLPVAGCRPTPRLEAGRTYTVVVPADMPVKQFWALTMYDRATMAYTEFVRTTLDCYNCSMSGTDLHVEVHGEIIVITQGLQQVCNKPLPEQAEHLRIGGEGGIRTHGADNRTTAFEL